LSFSKKFRTLNFLKMLPFCCHHVGIAI